MTKEDKIAIRVVLWLSLAVVGYNEAVSALCRYDDGVKRAEALYNRGTMELEYVVERINLEKGARHD